MELLLGERPGRVTWAQYHSGPSEWGCEISALQCEKGQAKGKEGPTTGKYRWKMPERRFNPEPPVRNLWTP